MTNSRGLHGLRILVNFLPLDRGGGLQNAMNFWRAVAQYGEGDAWTAVARAGSPLRHQPRRTHQRLRELPFRGSLARLTMGSRYLVLICREINADVCLTLAGPGPMYLPVPTVNGWHEPHPAYPDAEWWDSASLVERVRATCKYRYARWAVGRARIVIVQTSVMADRLVAAWGLSPGRIRIIPNSPSMFLDPDAAPEATPTLATPPVLLTLSEPYPHKNLDILVPVASLLANRSRPVRFRISLSAREPAGVALLARARASGVGDWFDLIGRVPHDRIARTYADVDGVLLPSLLESFSANYLEAMSMNRCILTSDRDFARVVCADAALYFDPRDPHDIAAVIESWCRDPQLRLELSRRGREQLRAFPTWRQRFDLYRAVIGEAVPAPAGARGTWEGPLRD